MRYNRMIGTLIVLGGLLAGPLGAQERQTFQQGLRSPSGIYATVNISSEISKHPFLTHAELNAYFNNLYQELLGNPAVAGLAIQAHWDQLNPNPPSAAKPYDWDFVDDAFAQVSLWDGQNPNKPPKTIQFIMMPGFQSPQWVLDQIPSCDGMFEQNVTIPPSNCGRVTFMGKVEEQDSTQLPLPWDPFYKSAWSAFLVALNERYGANTALVSISVAGPTASSDEMIEPNDNNCKNPQTMFGNPPMLSPPISPNDMWRALLVFHYPDLPEFQDSDQAFIEEWDAAIDMYGGIFQDLTLVATTGSGLPNLSKTGFTIPKAFTWDCSSNPDMDCGAETTILSHFVDPLVGGLNTKATQTSGLEASSSDDADLGIGGVKMLSQLSEHSGDGSGRILGGAQFNTAFSTHPKKEGDSSEKQQALFNVLQVFFTATPAAGLYCESKGGAPLNYLEIYSIDFLYAASHGSAPVTEGTCGTVDISAQEELNMASQRLFVISEPPPDPSF
jgi:hypothetical protein